VRPRGRGLTAPVKVSVRFTHMHMTRMRGHKWGCVIGLAAAVLCPIIGCEVISHLLLYWKTPFPEFFSSQILSPVPDGMTDVTPIYYLNPTLGDGCFVARFHITDLGKRNLLLQREWKEVPVSESMMLKISTNDVDLSRPVYMWTSTNGWASVEFQFSERGGGIIAGVF
jgi:hypothetical protein